MYKFIFFLMGVIMRFLFLVESAVQRIAHKFLGYGKKWKSAKNQPGLKLEIGGGETPRLKALGFTNMDLRDLDEVDIVANAWSIPEEHNGQVNYIFSRHMLEHLAHYEIELVVKNWAKAMADGGIIEIMVPNISFAVAQLLGSIPGSRTNFKAHMGFDGKQRCEGQNYWDVHKQSFTHDSILKAFKEHMTIKNHHFDRQRSRHIHLYLEVAKPT